MLTLGKGLLGILAMILLLAPAAGSGAEELTTFYAPILGPAGQRVYYLERHYTLDEITPPGLKVIPFTSPGNHARLASDRLLLKEVEIASGQSRALMEVAPTPAQGQRVPGLGGRFCPHLEARLTLSRLDRLELELALTVVREGNPQTMLLAASCPLHQTGLVPAPAWRPGPVARGPVQVPYRRWQGQREVVLAPGPHPLCPAALALVEVASGQVRVLAASPEYEDQYPRGLALEALASRLSHPAVPHDWAHRQRLAAYLREERQKGLPLEAAQVAALARLPRRKGWRAPCLRARLAGPEQGREPLFRLSRAELDQGCFPDLARALARPDSLVFKEPGPYVLHPQHLASQALNDFLAQGGRRFRVAVENRRWLVTIEPLPERRKKSSPLSTEGRRDRL